MNFRQTKVFNFEGAIRGMRNPMKSWDSSDSKFGYKHIGDEIDSENAIYAEFNQSPFSSICEYAAIGPADLKLMQSLIKGGGDHSKFMRQIVVSVDITAPRYFWSEFDTYHFNTKNSESTMHKLLTSANPLTLDDFEQSGSQLEAEAILDAIKHLEKIRQMYQATPANSDATEKTKLLRTAKKILPESFLQKRTVLTNYAELRNIYLQRKSHRLPEWKIYFVNWIKALPFAEQLIMT